MIWRFRHLEDFRLLREQGQKYRSRAFTVVYAPVELQHPPHLAFALGRHLGGAVRRNKLRRQLKELAANCCSVGGFYLVRPHPAAMSMDFSELQSAFEAVLLDIERSQS